MNINLVKIIKKISKKEDWRSELRILKILKHSKTSSTNLLTYLDFYEKYPGEATFNIARAHLHKFLHSGFNLHGHGDLREKLNNIDTKYENLDELKKIAIEMKKRRLSINPIDKITWYYRHWKA